MAPTQPSGPADPGPAAHPVPGGAPPTAGQPVEFRHENYDYYTPTGNPSILGVVERVMGATLNACQHIRLEQGLSMRPADPIPRTNAAAYTHPELSNMIDTSNAGQVYELGQMWNDLGNEIMDFGANLGRTAISSEAIWVGKAGDTARATLSKLATWCHDTGQGAQYMGTVMRTQAEAAETARTSMPVPVPYDPAAYQNRINSTSNPVEWVQILGDAREQAARHDAAHAEAVRVVETYSTSLLSTNGAMPAFAPPPEFGDRDADPSLPPPTPGGGHGGAGGGYVPGGSPGGGERPQIPPGSGDGGPGGGRPDHGEDGRRPENEPPASTPGQVAPHVPGSPGHNVPPGGGGGTGIPGFPPAAGVGGAAEHRPGVGAGRQFGPRGSGVSSALGRGGLASVTGAEGAIGAGRAGAGLAGRGPGISPGAGGAFAPMVGGGRGRGAEDTEHRRPSYLVETEDIWGDGRRVAPAVIGEDPPEPDNRGAQ